LDVQCMIVAKKNNQTPILFQNLLKLTLKKIVNNALHLVSEGCLNSYVYKISKSTLHQQ
jgi:hypothetical protein